MSGRAKRCPTPLPHQRTGPAIHPSTDNADDLLRETERAQADASDPDASAWVSANAGAGKTHVLKQRVLRILLSGTAPDRILCLTYTKAAAAEMASRVFRDLSSWATAATPDLHKSITKVLAREPTANELAAARSLFARAIETPGGLKVQTIHAFCERLLQRFPLEAGVPPGFTILDDAETARLIRSGVDAVLGEATRSPLSQLGLALQEVVAFAAGDAFDDVLRSALGKRDWLASVAGYLIPGSNGEDPVANAYRSALGIRAGTTRKTLLADMAGVIEPASLRHAAGILTANLKSKTDVELGERLVEAANAPGDVIRVAALTRAFLTKDGDARSDTRFVTKPTRTNHPEIADILTRARDRFANFNSERQALLAADASTALMRLAGDVMQHYVDAKANRAAMDFDDLIVRTANLLSSADAAGWVLHKLDGGLDHILVDEAQDTSPRQWEVIEALAQEFFPVMGGTRHSRTIFAVGDEKQSIYSFQGAEPRMFAETGERFRQSAEAAHVRLRKVPLTLSFRTVEPLLAAVDKVLSDRRRTPGVTAGDSDIRHVARRIGQAGRLEIWETEKPQEAEDVDAWLPLGEQTQASPVTRLAERIASTIRRWLDTGERLESENRPVREGDVIILLRRRAPFAGPMVAALKEQGIAVAGADRLRLVEQLAVQDLIVLGDFLTLPEDDLALATVLKSPLFGLDDHDLLTLAAKRKGATLWSSLLAAGRQDLLYAPHADKLKRWRGIADQSPPFEFYAHVLDRDGGRKQLIERLGPESIDTITEFLSLAIDFDASETPSLTGFLEWLRTGTREVKRDMEHGRNEVRVLTVHGAKGLEAPIVFLPDTCAAPSARQQGKLFDLDVPGLTGRGSKPVAWPVKGTGSIPAIKAAKEASAQKEREESNRLLYVAMTRARDRLYITGWEGKRARPRDCWYDIVQDGLADDLERNVATADGIVGRLQNTQTAPFEKPHDLAADAASPLAPPAWATTPAPRETQLMLPLAPSRLAPYDVDETGDPIERAPTPGAAPAEPPAPSPMRIAGSHRFQRGLLTHALLEHLPTLPQSGWRKAAQAFVETRGAMLPQGVRASIAAEVLALLHSPDFAAAFGPDSRAEVPLVAEIPQPQGKGPPLRLNAVIDRLVILQNRIQIIDYKTNRPPPAEPSGVAAAYTVQLAAYRLALQRIYPAHDIQAAILWTDGARLMPMPSRLLDEAERELWRLAKSRVEARHDVP